MADTPRQWQILEAVQARLQEISTGTGYRTDIGTGVFLEPAQAVDNVDRVTLYSARTHAGDPRNPKQRAFDLVAEIIVPIGIGDAHRRAVDAAEDVEQALDTFLPLPGALPLRFEESVILDRPDGIAAMVVQLMFSTGYRR